MIKLFDLRMATVEEMVSYVGTFKDELIALNKDYDLYPGNINELDNLPIRKFKDEDGNYLHQQGCFVLHVQHNALTEQNIKSHFGFYDKTLIDILRFDKTKFTHDACFVSVALAYMHCVKVAGFYGDKIAYMDNKLTELLAYETQLECDIIAGLDCEVNKKFTKYLIIDVDYRNKRTVEHTDAYDKLNAQLEEMKRRKKLYTSFIKCNMYAYSENILDISTSGNFIAMLQDKNGDSSIDIDMFFYTCMKEGSKIGYECKASKMFASVANLKDDMTTTIISDIYDLHYMNKVLYKSDTIDEMIIEARAYKGVDFTEGKIQDKKAHFKEFERLFKEWFDEIPLIDYFKNESNNYILKGDMKFHFNNSEIRILIDLISGLTMTYQNGRYDVEFNNEYMTTLTKYVLLKLQGQRIEQKFINQ